MLHQAPSAIRPDVRYADEVVEFDCRGERLLGILSRPAEAVSRCAMLIVVGGPQYRVGSHRQFALLARRLAAAGVPVLRFDGRGMGDSAGAQRNFEEFGDDIAAALDALARACPQAGKLAVWGLCDAASAALMHAAADPRVAGLALANPWVRSVATLAQTHLRHYYPKRVLQADFWMKILRGRFDWSRALGALGGAMKASRGSAAAGRAPASFQERMLQGLQGFRGRVLLILSGDDLTAKEFVEHSAASPQWSALLSAPRVERFELAGANHTFSSQAWRSAVEDRTLQWLASL